MAQPSTLSHYHHPAQQTASIPDVQMSAHSLAESNVSHCPESQETEMQDTQPVDDVELGSQEKREKEEYESRLWGFLHPCTTCVSRIDFLKPQTSYKFGRNRQMVDKTFPATKISAFLLLITIVLDLALRITGNLHCTIVYDTRTEDATIHDHSSNGTYV
jgi:hypothetical protein